MTSISRGLSLCDKIIEHPQYLRASNESDDNSRMAGWPDEIKACMHPQITFFRTLRLLFLSHVYLMLIIDKIDDWDPRVTVVDVVTKARRVNHCQLDFELLFFKFCFNNLDFSQFVELLEVTTTVVLGGVQLSGEKSVDERGFPQTRLALLYFST